MSRTAIAVLSTENLIHNMSVIKEHVKPAKVIAMIKANAYGHGIRSVAQRLDKHTDMFGVASIDEALALRAAGVKAPIMLAQGVYEPNELLVASTEKFHVVFHNQAQIEWLERATLPVPLQIWLKIDTGMGRLGLGLDEARTTYARLLKCKNIKQPIRILSHLACSEDVSHPKNVEQIEKFNTFKAEISTEYSLCNSGGIFNFKECHYDFVRPGLALYGVTPLKDGTAKDLNLKPVMTLQSSLISVRNLKKGDSVGYGARYTCGEDMPVGIIAFGYGDGYPLFAQDGTPILVNGKECKLIGRISMDMIAIDLRACPTAQVGDLAILWGDGLPIERVVAHTKSITWNLLTGIQNRVKFLWIRDSF